ncbi:sulfate/thiosulfate transporter permease subunit [Shigella sonnei]|nr:sulfate/thiosulfate transporter permease subunit [Shigella sonnei]
MAEVTQLKRYDARPINWGKWFLIGIGMLVSAFILLVPMIYIFVQAFSKGLMPVLQNLADPDMLHAIWLTVMIALIAVPVNLVFGILLAWLVTRFNFPGRQLLLTLLDIPFAVSPVVAGLVYLLFYGSNGPLGGWLDEHNLQIMFSWPGMVLVTIFVTCPFVVAGLQHRRLLYRCGTVNADGDYHPVFKKYVAVAPGESGKTRTAGGTS